MWISRIRRKLGAAPGEQGRIKTFPGIGYLLDADADHVGPGSESAPAEAAETPDGAPSDAEGEGAIAW